MQASGQAHVSAISEGIIGWMLARCGEDCAGRGENDQLERQRAAYHLVAKIAVVLALSCLTLPPFT
jgi:hypothetical protein